MRYSFPKSVRLLKRRQFLRKTRRYFGDSILVDVKKNQTAQTRLGIIVTKRFGKAILRNRFKRIVREAFRLSQHKIPLGIDIIVRPGRNALQAKMPDVERELCRILG
ncbi:MAG: ribonuclease P protein component [Waddliaceae bacterium]